MPLQPTIPQLRKQFGIRTADLPVIKTGAGVAGNKFLTGISDLVKASHVKTNNPYLSKIPQPAERDQEIFKDGDYNLLGKSLNNPVVTSLQIQGGTYTDNSGKSYSYPRIDLETVILMVTLPRNIVKTQIIGRKGTVKEYIGEDDAQITIQGMICGDNGVYPYTAVNQLLQVINAPVAVGVVSPYLQLFKINYLVFETREIPQEPGGYSFQSFSLTAVSDIEQEARIIS